MIIKSKKISLNKNFKRRNMNNKKEEEFFKWSRR